jgi:hypothetical protein
MPTVIDLHMLNAMFWGVRQDRPAALYPTRTDVRDTICDLDTTWAGLYHYVSDAYPYPESREN